MKGILAALACAAIALLAVAALDGDQSDSATKGRGSDPVNQAAADRPPASRTPAEKALARGLDEGVQEAAVLGGEVEAAAMLDASSAPLVSSSGAGGVERYVRMWSISKVATAVTFLRLLGWGDRFGEVPSPEVASALSGALTRSENCRQRRVVLELQEAARGIPETRRALAETLSTAEAEVIPASQVRPPEQICVPFLSRQREIPDPLAPTLLLGTSRWRIGDAARLAHALAVETYGKAISNQVLELMRAPKQPSRESEEGELTAPLDWGAGTVFRDSAPAYKAGWGGVLNGNFLVGQIAVVPLSEGDHLSIAVVFHPDVQPVRDDPGVTAGPEAVETVMEAVRTELARAGARPLPGSSVVTRSD